MSSYPGRNHTKRGEAIARTSAIEYDHRTSEDHRPTASCPLCVKNEATFQASRGYGLEVDR